MKGWRTLWIVALILLCSGATWADYVSLRPDVQGDRPEVNILRHDAEGVTIEVRLPGVELREGVLEGRKWDRVEIPGGAWLSEPGAPEIPNFSRLLAIPARTGVRAEFEALETTVLSDIELMPDQGDEPEELMQKGQPVRFDMAAYSQDAFYPEEEVLSGEPAILRGMRVVRVQMNPVRYNPVTKELRIAHRYRVTVHFEGTDLRNVPSRPMRPVSRSWVSSMQGAVMNLDQLDLEMVEMGSYLIVCEDNDYLVDTLLEPLIDWKKRKGHTVVVERFTPNASTTTIKSIIQAAYDNWEVPPEYVLLWGDTDGEYALAGYEYYGIDHPYSQLDGGDILADVALGRYPADDAIETMVMVNKVLFYEKMPYTGHPDWFHEGVLVAGSSSSGLSTVLANRWIKTRLIEHEYTEIDTFWYWMGSPYTYVPLTLTNGINDGATYVNYRGWLGMQGFDNYDIQALTNSFMLPFVTILTCGTGGFGGSESRMECFSNVGTPQNPTGAVACVGTATSSTHTRYLNAIDIGMYACIFDMGCPRPGHALNMGKLELYNGYHEHDAGQVTNFSKWAALAGDPGLQLFTGPIHYMNSTIPATVVWGENSITLTVDESGVGPVEDAVVCLYKENELQEVGYTDASGQVTLPLDVGAAGNVKVTITKENFYPIVDSLDVVQADVVVGYFDHSIDDDSNGSSSGDDDGIINPGETVEIPLVFKNYGSSTTATNVTVTATESDDYATLNDNYETFPNMAPGATANSNDDFDLVIAADCPHGHVVRLELATNSDQGNWDGVIDLTVVSYDINIREAYAVGSDTLLSPGETADFILTISNEGEKTAESLTATITSLDPYVTVNDNSAGFGTVNPQAGASCSANPFNLTAAQDTPPGHLADLKVEFVSATGATQTDTLTISLGTKSMTDPQGPDEYGYYCFDNTDMNYAQAPVYNWIEIDPAYGGSGTQLPINDTGEDDDMSVIVNLPFTFRYYGEETDQITVCSNGWISTTPNVAFAQFANYPIPSYMGPNGLIAAFWDDLITGSGGYVFSKNDAANHRFIIEWSRMRNRGNTSVRETFEIILFDPDYYPTVTGDSEILFQYESITEVSGAYYDNPYSTVGIERPDHLDGIEIVYWNTYHDPATAHLQAGRAYFFTTNLDYSPPGSELYVSLIPYGAPIVIPPGGGSFDFNIEVGNTSANPATADVWCDVMLPNGTIYGPTLGPVTGIVFQGNWSTNRDRTQTVPAGAPAGAYTYNAYVGVYPNTVYDQDSFDWSKSGDDGSGKWTEGWENFGEPFLSSGTEATVEIPESYALHAAYPNPFNPVTNLRFDLPEAARVKLEVYDLQGRVVAELVNGHRDAGVHEVTWNASNLSSGMYFYRIQAGDFSAVQKVILMK